MIVKLTQLPFELSGNIYRSVMPFGQYDPQGTLIERYQQAGINLVIILAEEAEIIAQTGQRLSGLYAEMGMGVIELPIMDFEVPNPDSLLPVIQTTFDMAQAGENIVIHCSAGLGRTGLFTACLAKTILKFNGQEAIDWTRQHIPGAIETQKQIEFIQAYNP